MARLWTVRLEGLASALDEEKEYFYERLADIYNDMNEAAKAADAEAMLKKCREQSRSVSSFGRVKLVNPVPKTHSEPIRVEKVGRNQPCPCGSGKKYKKCCGKNVR